jgi:hypothetical protein
MAGANMHLSMAILNALRGQWSGAASSALRAVVAIPPWRWPRLVRSAAIVPRVAARLQMRRRTRP